MLLHRDGSVRDTRKSIDLDKLKVPLMQIHNCDCV